MEIEYEGETKGLRTYRKHILWYTKGLRGGARLRNALGALQDREAILDALHGFLNAPA
jgi:tRNA-dihydrouridine synthase B